MKIPWPFPRNVAELVRLSCILALIGLAIMVYSVLVPRPLPVIGAMTVGQGFGIGAFLCYLFAVIVDARSATRSADQDSEP